MSTKVVIGVPKHAKLRATGYHAGVLGPQPEGGGLDGVRRAKSPAEGGGRAAPAGLGQSRRSAATSTIPGPFRRPLRRCPCYSSAPSGNRSPPHLRSGRLSTGSLTPSPVAAKLARPRMDGVVLRPDTVADFRQATRRRLALFCAPAGYGKTTVAATAVERLGLTSVWYKLDVLDRDPVVFLAALTEALREHFAEFGDAIRERVRTAAEAPFPISHLQAIADGAEDDPPRGGSAASAVRGADDAVGRAVLSSSRRLGGRLASGRRTQRPRRARMPAEAVERALP